MELVTANLSDTDKRRIRAYAGRTEQMAFFHVVPGETGLERTIWLTQSDAYPALLVSPSPGRFVAPPRDVLVFGFDETTPYRDVNAWLAVNRHLLLPLARQEIDVGDFYDGMRKYQAQ